MRQAIGIDLGGTNLKGALVEESGVVLSHATQPSGAARPPKETIADLLLLIEQLERAAGKPGTAIGLGIPGIVDPKAGVVYRSPHFPQWKKLPIRQQLEKKLKRTIFLDNDANCVLQGEAWCGAGQGHLNLLLLTLGTGIGGGLLLQGEVWRGERGFAGEVGHIVVEPDGVACPCGSHGCFERYASGSALVRMSREVGTQRTPLQLFEAAEQGEATAKELFHHFGYYLGIGIASLVNVLGVHTVIVGGGVSRAWNYFIEAARKEFGRRTYEETARMTTIVPATLGDDGGMIGAAYGALYKL